MANYHVAAMEDGTIIAGSVNKSGKFTNSSVVTEEVLSAARDHLLILTAKENKDISYAWKYENGKTLLLKLEERDSNEIQDEEPAEETAKEENNEGVSQD